MPCDRWCTVLLLGSAYVGSPVDCRGTPTRREGIGKPTRRHTIIRRHTTMAAG